MNRNLVFIVAAIFIILTALATVLDWPVWVIWVSLLFILLALIYFYEKAGK